MEVRCIINERYVWYYFHFMLNQEFGFPLRCGDGTHIWGYQSTVCCALGKGAPSYKSNITWCAIISLYIMSNYQGLYLHKNATTMVIKPNIVCYCVCYIDQSIFLLQKWKITLLKYIYVLHTIYGELDKSYWKFHTSVMSISKFADIPWHSSTSIIKFLILVIIWWQSARLASRAYRHLCSCIASPRNKMMFMFSHRTIIIRERLSEINRLRWSRHVERVGVTGKVSASLAPSCYHVTTTWASPPLFALGPSDDAL